MLLLFSVCVLTHFALVYGDYDCLCNYNVEKAVFDRPDIHTPPIGYIYEFDCKPVYGTTSNGSSLMTIYYEHQVGYVQPDGNMVVQKCDGDIPIGDTIHTTPHHTVVLTSTTTLLITIAPTQPSTPSLITTTLQPLSTTTTAQSTTTRQTTSTTSKTTSPKTSKTTSTMPTTSKRTSPRTSKTTSTTPTTTKTTSPTPTTTTTTTVSLTAPTTTLTKTIPTTTSSMPATTTTNKPTIPPSSCPYGWVMHGNSCYMFRTDDRKHWSKANMLRKSEPEIRNNYGITFTDNRVYMLQTDCVHRSSHLVIIETSNEEHFLTYQLNNRIDTDQDDTSTAVWMAGTDNDKEGHWKWYNGLTDTYSHLTYTNWKHGQPDDHHGEDCMSTVGNKDFEWKDYSCSKDLYYVCEKDVVHTSHVPHVTNAPGTGSQPHGASKCDYGWILHRESCYILHTNNRSKWPDANNYCLTHHAHLASIDSAEENTFLAHVLRQHINLGVNRNLDTGVWVAGTDRANEMHWVWMEGNSLKPVQYTNWQPGEPNHGDGDCMAMIGKENFQWNDYHCDEHMYFVCERPAYLTNVGSLLVG